MTCKNVKIEELKSSNAKHNFLQSWTRRNSMVDKQFGKIVRDCCLFLSISMLTCVLWFSAQIWLGQTSLNQVPISHYCFRLYLVRFHLILPFWFSFVNSVNVTSLDPANIVSGSLLVCSRLHSWHKIKMFLAYNHCRGSASDQGK